VAWVNRLLLGIGAATAIVLALAILFLPGPFYAGYGIEPGTNVSLLNELKAPALVILALGLLQALAVLGRVSLPLGLGAGLLLYLGFGTARLIAMATDGLPSSGLVAVTMVEVLLGLGFAFAFWQQRAR
jgi:hypothetical protein